MGQGQRRSLGPWLLARVTCSPSRCTESCAAEGTGLTQSPPSVPSHAVNLLGNLPVKCLDVLLALEPRRGSLEFLGVNMDVMGALLSFLEKRLHQVGGDPPAGLPVACLPLAGGGQLRVLVF